MKKTGQAATTATVDGDIKRIHDELTDMRAEVVHWQEQFFESTRQAAIIEGERNAYRTILQEMMKAAK